MCFALCAIPTGILYAGVIRVLRQSKQNVKGKKIANAFIFLWLSWLFCVLPFLAVDLYACRLMDLNSFARQFGRWYEPTGFFDHQAQTTLLGQGGDYTQWNKSTQVASGLYTAASSLKHSYGFINSIVLIVILNPFRQPIVRVCSKVKGFVCSTSQPMKNSK